VTSGKNCMMIDLFGILLCESFEIDFLQRRRSRMSRIEDEEWKKVGR
jgi:hypothetical protein